MASSGEVVTYRQLDERSNQGAHLLRSQGCQTEDAIAVLMYNSARYLELVWATQRAGLYCVCMPVRMTPKEVRYLLQDSGAKLLVYSLALEATVHAALADLEGVYGLPIVADDPSAASFVGLRAAMPTTPIADEAPGVDMLYSSGTTGFPKGIKRPRPQGSIDEPLPVTGIVQQLYGQDEHTVYLSPAPLYHAAPLRFCMANHQLGGTDIIMEKFDPVGALELIQKHRVTHAQWVPTHFVRMLKLPEAQREAFDHSSLRCVYHAAAPCPVDIKRKMIEWWGPIIHEYYSSTEMNGLTAVTSEEWLARPGTVGRPILGNVRICDEQGQELPTGEEGLVYFEQGNPFEYHNNPEATKRTTNAHGWTTVGDIGRVDDHGYLFLTDRQSFMIISGGVNIYPQEIEDLLICHPDVADAAVFGAPDPDFGEKVVAVVQPKDPDAPTANLADQLRAYARARLSSHKVPKEIAFRDSLPRQPTGKLFKRLLRDEYRAATR